MAGEFPADLRADLQAEVVRMLKLLQEAGWSVDPIHWESGWDRTSELRVGFTAKSEAGKSVRQHAQKATCQRVSRFSFVQNKSTYLSDTTQAPSRCAKSVSLQFGGCFGKQGFGALDEFIRPLDHFPKCRRGLVLTLGLSLVSVL
jgi:hypothetical protein